jgi:lipopolysaccharide/colanic/teichoic acid biosynthesis glycosyltransferase
MMFEPSPLKRAIDLVVAVPLAIAAAPMCLLLLGVVALESPGSPLLVQQRVGRAQRPFRMLKIRTMKRDTPHVASHDVGRTSVTRVGAVLRRLKLDELPQLLNVIGGSMSLVGPRPCLPSQTVLIAERERRGVFALKPGVTGPAQLMGIDMSTPERLAEVEAEYFSKSTPLGEIGLIARTFAGKGQGDAVRPAGNR